MKVCQDDLAFRCGVRTLAALESTDVLIDIYSTAYGICLVVVGFYYRPLVLTFTA